MNTEKLFNEIEAALFLNCSRSWLRKLRMNGTGPYFVKMGPKAVRYRREDLEAYISKSLKQNTLVV